MGSKVGFAAGLDVFLQPLCHEASWLKEYFVIASLWSSISYDTIISTLFWGSRKKVCRTSIRRMRKGYETGTSLALELSELFWE
jgi:hypothetical protein